MKSVLNISDLVKRYGKLTAVNRLSLEVPGGSVYGILGPNGSGKTTTLSIILGILNCDGGTFHWFNEKTGSSDRNRIGSLLEKPNFYPYLTAFQNLKITADIKEVSYSRIDVVLDVVKLLDRKDTKYSSYSTGMKQRLGIANALLADPDVLVLDEPTNGLDPQGISDVRNLIKTLGAAGKTIILASHLLDEVEKVCTHVAVIKKGNLLTSGPVNEALNSEDQIELASEDLALLSSFLSKHCKIERIETKHGRLIIPMSNLNPAVLNKKLAEAGISLNHLSIRQKSLESQFLELTSDSHD